MANSLMLTACALWIITAFATSWCWLGLSRLLLAAGGIIGIFAAIVTLPDATGTALLPIPLAGERVAFRLDPEALWLMGFGLVPAVFACALSSPSREGARGWLFGAALCLIGALGIFGVQNGAAFLISWELMSLGGAVMILSERLELSRGRTVLFMLALLEVGAIALVLAVIVLGVGASSLDFAGFIARASSLSEAMQLSIGILLLIGFGAKLGLLPFYEWFPGAYGAGSGATGAILSGVVLNAAYFGLARGLCDWLPAKTDSAFPLLSAIVIVVATISAILTILYAFQQDDWRRLLSFSSAENASIAVVALGAAMLFRAYDLSQLAGLAWTVALLHLAGHALAKGTLFLAADGLRSATKSYAIIPSGAGSHRLFGIGAFLAGLSLAAMPPAAGFVSEWFVFQTVFQGFHLPSLGSRLILALTGAGLALTAAVAFATFVKVIGIGILGRGANRASVRRSYSFTVIVLGLSVLALGAGMPFWLPALDLTTATHFGSVISQQMHDGLRLVPLTAKFAFISPTLLIVVMPLLALIPIMFVIWSRRFPVRRGPVWYGGLFPDPARATTTSLTFSNAMRTFYSFVYRPTAAIGRDSDVGGYFVKKLDFEHDVAPIFGPLLFQPVVHFVRAAAGKLRLLQSGNLNFYLSLIGLLLVLILALTLA